MADSKQAMLIRRALRRAIARAHIADDLRSLFNAAGTFLDGGLALPHNAQGVLSATERERLQRIHELLEQVVAEVDRLDLDPGNGDASMAMAKFTAGLKRKRLERFGHTELAMGEFDAAVPPKEKKPSKKRNADQMTLIPTDD